MKVIIVGCGHLGAILAQRLVQDGQNVTVIDMDSTAFERLDNNFKGTLLTGVGFDRDVLLEAGIERSDSLVAVTNNDDANIVTALIARDFFHVPTVLGCVFDPHKTDIYNRLGLHTISPNKLGIERILARLSHSQLDTVLTMGSGEVEVLVLEVPPILVGKQVKEITWGGETIVISITRHNRAFIPTLGTLFEAGDIAHIATIMTAVDHLRLLVGLS